MKTEKRHHSLIVEFNNKNQMIQLFLCLKHQIIGYVSTLSTELNTYVISSCCRVCLFISILRSFRKDSYMSLLKWNRDGFLNDFLM